MSLLDPIHAALDFILPTATPEEEAAGRLEDELRKGKVLVLTTPSEEDLEQLRKSMNDPAEAKWEVDRYIFGPDQLYLSPRAVEACEKAFGTIVSKKKDPGA